MRFLIAFLLFTNVHAEEINQEDLAVIQKFMPEKEEVVIVKKEKVFTDEEIEEILDTRKNFVFLKAQTRVFSRSDDKTFYLPKGTYAYVYVGAPNSPYVFIESKEKQIKFYTLKKDILPIDEVTLLREKPLRFRPEKKKPKAKIDIIQGKYAYGVNIDLGASSNKYLANITGENGTTGFTSRVEGNIQSRFDLSSNFSFPVQYGLFLRWETLSGTLDAGKYNQRTLATGPMFKILKNDKSYFIKAGLALFSELTIDSADKPLQQFSLSETSVMLGFDKESNFFNLGKTILGVNIQRKWPKAKSDELGLDLTPGTFTDDSIALTFGFLRGSK